MVLETLEKKLIVRGEKLMEKDKRVLGFYTFKSLAIFQPLKMIRNIGMHDPSIRGFVASIALFLVALSTIITFPIPVSRLNTEVILGQDMTCKSIGRWFDKSIQSKKK